MMEAALPGYVTRRGTETLFIYTYVAELIHDIDTCFGSGMHRGVCVDVLTTDRSLSAARSLSARVEGLTGRGPRAGASLRLAGGRRGPETPPEIVWTFPPGPLRWVLSS